MMRYFQMLLQTVSFFFKIRYKFLLTALRSAKNGLTTHLQVFEENHITILKSKLISNSGKIYHHHNNTFIALLRTVTG